MCDMDALRTELFGKTLGERSKSPFPIRERDKLGRALDRSRRACEYQRWWVRRRLDRLDETWKGCLREQKRSPAEDVVAAGVFVLGQLEKRLAYRSSAGVEDSCLGGC